MTKYFFLFFLNLQSMVCGQPGLNGRTVRRSVEVVLGLGPDHAITLLDTHVASHVKETLQNKRAVIQTHAPVSYRLLLYMEPA